MIQLKEFYTMCKSDRACVFVNVLRCAGAMPERARFSTSADFEAGLSVTTSDDFVREYGAPLREIVRDGGGFLELGPSDDLMIITDSECPDSAVFFTMARPVRVHLYAGGDIDHIEGLYLVLESI